MFELGGKVFFTDEDNNVGAQRNGTNPQEWRIYNTYSSISDYERLITKWVDNELVISTEADGSGTLREIYLKHLKVAPPGLGTAKLENCPAENPDKTEWIQIEGLDGTPRYIPAYK